MLSSNQNRLYRKSHQSVASKIIYDKVSKKDDDDFRVADSVMEGFVFKETEAEDKASSKAGHGSPEQTNNSRFK